ncbi:hypothetical protein [Vibrio sp. Y53_MX_L15]|uniref:hypothetical protein n=1 Tax=Vibrio sp. Y53_MX_L15 TaxID=2957764 RepID=UPI0035C7F18C
MSHWSAEDEPISATLKRADDALYQAKHNGRNRTELDPSSERPEINDIAPLCAVLKY